MSTSTELSLIPDIDDPREIFAPGGLDPILAWITTQVSTLDLDISSPAGRREIASIARKIASSKAFIDDAGKNLVSDIKEKAKLIDAERKRARDFLDELKEKTRAPLTEWEQRDEKRIAAHEAAITGMAELNDLLSDGTIGQIEGNIHALEAIYAGRDWEEFDQRAKTVHRNAEHWLGVKLERATKAKQEAEELARLRREAAEREQRERDERIAREAVENERLQAEKRAKDEANAQTMRELADRQALELARLAAEERAKREKQARIDSEARAKAAAAKAKEAIERAKKDATDRERKRAEAERHAKEEEDRVRWTDLNHRLSIENDVVIALCEIPGAKITHDQAELIIEAIVKNHIPNITITY